MGRMRFMDVKSRVARNVRTLRGRLGLTQEELAARASIHSTYLSAVEGGKRNPSLEVLDRLAGGLRVDIGELFRKD